MKFMRVKKVGVYVEEGRPITNSDHKIEIRNDRTGNGIADFWINLYCACGWESDCNVGKGARFEEGVATCIRDMQHAAELFNEHLKSTWVSYKLWVCDLAECPSCKAQMLYGFPGNRIAEHYEPEYKGWLERVKDKLLGRIDDCGGLKP